MPFFATLRRTVSTLFGTGRRPATSGAVGKPALFTYASGARETLLYARIRDVLGFLLRPGRLLCGSTPQSAVPGDLAQSNVRLSF